MAVHCEFIDIIIPIANIDRVYPGGFAAYKAEHALEFNGRMYHDEYLFRDGAMSSIDARLIVAEWERRGLIPLKVIDVSSIGMSCVRLICLPDLLVLVAGQYMTGNRIVCI